jgi:hypothetical protein
VTQTRRGEVTLVVVGSGAMPAFEVAYDFGDVARGSSKTVDLEATNTGKDPLVLSAPHFEGTPSGSWFVRGPSGTMQPGKTFTLTVTFSPVNAGADEARLVFEHDADAQSALAVLSGIGL